MKKYIIIETWNGEGYTDSTAKVMEFKSDTAAEEYCLIKSKEQADAMGTKCYRIPDDNNNDLTIAYGYTDREEEDSGAYSFVPFTKDIIGVILNPCINDFEVVKDIDTWNGSIAAAINNGENEDEVAELESGDDDHVFIHSGGESGDALFVRLNKPEINIVDAVITLAAAVDANTENLWEGDMSEPQEAVKIVNILHELSDLEKEAKKLSAKEQVKNDTFVQNMTLANDRITTLEQGLKDCRQAMLDTGFFNKDSLQIISIDNLLNK